MREWAVVAGSVLVVGAGCNDGAEAAPPADFSGKYSISVTNTTNDCNFDGWRVGESSSNITFDITQVGAEASGELQGLASIYFGVLGIGTLRGPVNGFDASISNTGTTSIRKGRCAYFVKATADISLTGNTINGTVTYTPQTNHDPECGTLETCSSTQSVSGNRPPK